MLRAKQRRQPIRHSSCVFFVATLACLVVGCAGGRERDTSARRTPAPPREPTVAAGDRQDHRQAADTRFQESIAAVETVAYADRLRSDAEASFGDLLLLDTPAGSGASTPESETPDSPSDAGADAESVSASSSTSSDSTAVSVQDSVGRALASHPSVLAARQRVAAELNRVAQVTALPDPQFKNTFWPLQDQALQTAGGRVANQMSLQQGVPFPDKLRTRGAIVGHEAQMAQAELEKIERRITEAVRLAYYEIWYAGEAIGIIKQSRAVVDDLTRVAEARYRSGGTQQDVLRARLETDRLDDQLVRLQRQKEVAQADLAALLQQPLSSVPEAGDLDLTAAPLRLEALIDNAERCNPSLRGLAAEIRRDRQQQRLACLQQYPDFMVGLNWALISDDEDVISPVANGHDNVSLTFGTTLPIWRDKIRSGIREAEHRSGSTRQRLEAERDQIYGQLRRLTAQADALIEQIRIYDERMIPRTEDALKLGVADYRGERTDFGSLIDTYRELLMLEMQLARIKATLAGTLAQIDRTVGCAN